MATHRNTWKAAERRNAAMFGTKRQPCSGSGGRADQTRSDSVHPALFIEGKLREKHATRSLWEATRALARKEGKTPVITLNDKGKPGCLICVHSDDFAAVVAEYVAALPDEEMAAIEAAIRAAWNRNRGQCNA